MDSFVPALDRAMLLENIQKVPSIIHLHWLVDLAIKLIGLIIAHGEQEKYE